MTTDQLKEEVLAATVNYDVAALEQLVADAAQLSDPEAAVWGEWARAKALEYTGYPAESVEIWESLLDRPLAPFMQSMILNALGVSLAMLSRRTEALTVHLKSLAIAEELGDEALGAKPMMNLGNIYTWNGDYAKAMEFFRRTLQHAEATGSTANCALCRSNIANVQKLMGDNDAAYASALAARELYRSIDRTAQCARLSAEIAMHKFNRGEEGVDEAIDEAMSVDVRSVGARNRAYIVSAVSWLRVQQGRYDEFFRLADEHRAELQPFPDVVSDMQRIKATVYIATQRWAEAREICERELEGSIARADIYRLIEDHKILRDISKELGDLDAYVTHNEEFQRLQLEYQGAESARKVATQEAEANAAKESERIAKERELMAKERTERNREKAILYSTLPQHIADRVIRGEEVTDHINEASVIFLDIVGFTTITSALTSQQVSTLLEAVFGACDAACSRNDVSRVKTIGDSFMALAYY